MTQQRGKCNYDGCTGYTVPGKDGTLLKLCYTHFKKQQEESIPEMDTCNTEGCNNKTTRQKLNPNLFYKRCFSCGKKERVKYFFNDSLHILKKAREQLEDIEDFDEDKYAEDLQRIADYHKELSSIFDKKVGEKRKREESI